MATAAKDAIPDAVLFADLKFPCLLIEKADQVVFKRRPGFVVLKSLLGTHIDAEQQVIRDLQIVVIIKIERIDLGPYQTIGHEAGKIAYVGRAKNRDNQKRAATNAVTRQGLSEILSLPVYAHGGCRIPETENADGRVDHQPARGPRGGAGL